MKKLIILPLVALILLGCSQPNTQQEADSKILQDEDLKKFREMVRNALPNSDLVQFHQQEALLHKPICKGFFSDIIFK